MHSRLIETHINASKQKRIGSRSHRGHGRAHTGERTE